MTEPELETALVVEVPAAEHVVGQFRAQLDANALLGVPAHITILAPFMPAGRIDAGTLADLESLASGIEAFDVFATFPEFPPFQGQFDEVVPHLTVGYDHDLDEMLHAEQVIGANLPIRARARAVTLMTELAPGGQWSTFATFSFR